MSPPDTGNPEQTDGWMGQAEGQAAAPHSYPLPFRPQPLGSSSQGTGLLPSTGLLEFGPGFSSAACLLPSGALPQTSRPGRHLPLGTEDSVPPREKASFYSDVQCSAPGPNLKGSSGRGLQLQLELVLSVPALFQLPGSSPLQI